MKVGFVGLGNMGEPIARNLRKSGYELIVYNRTRARADELQSAGAQVADTAVQASAVDVVFSMLSDDNAVSCLSTEILKGMQENTIHVSLSTISTQLSRQLQATHAEQGKRFVAAPVFGRPPAASAAQLVIVAAGPEKDIETVRPLLEVISRKLMVIGTEPHLANLIKLSGNFMIATILEGLAESCALVRKSSAPKELYLELISELFPSPIIKAYVENLTEDRFIPAGFAMELGLKDIRFLLAAAEEASVPMPIASLVRDNFISGIARGKGQSDWSALAEIASENAGM